MVSECLLGLLEWKWSQTLVSYHHGHHLSIHLTELKEMLKAINTYSNTAAPNNMAAMWNNTVNAASKAPLWITFRGVWKFKAAFRTMHTDWQMTIIYNLRHIILYRIFVNISSIWKCFDFTFSFAKFHVYKLVILQLCYRKNGIHKLQNSAIFSEDNFILRLNFAIL